MKVKELIEALSQYPEDYDVAINDVDGGNFFVGNGADTDFQVYSHTDNSEGERYVIIDLEGVQT